MFRAYQSFFAASAGASAAFIGLLFVALSFIDEARVDEKARAWRRIMASSSFAQLVDIFFVSLVGLTPDIQNVAFTGCIMAVLGLVIALRLLPRTMNRQVTGRSRPTALGLVAVAAYTVQLVSGLAIVRNPGGQPMLRVFIVALIFLYAGALARAWEITGLKQR